MNKKEEDIAHRGMVSKPQKPHEFSPICNSPATRLVSASFQDSAKTATIRSRLSRQRRPSSLKRRAASGQGCGFPWLAVRHFPFKQLHRSEEHTSELQSRFDLVCRLLLEKK